MKLTNRREMLGTLGSVPLIGMTASAAAGGTSNMKGYASTAPTLATKSDIEDYVRLRDLDMDEPAVAAKRNKMPVGKIGNLTFGRLMSGSNLISMNMHARDLDYVSALATHYNTEQRVLMTLKRCEEHGINGIVLKSHNFKRFRLSKYWDEWGSQMKWLADVITTDINKYEKLLDEHLELGASAAYLWGGASDIWYHQNKKDNIIRAYEIMRKYDFPVGICAHRIEPIKFCEKEGLKPDFYMKTLHHDRYWSAHPRANRRFIEMFEKESEDHAEYHDNMFCCDFEETIDFMQDVKVPWIAFKVLAAGAIDVMDGLRSAYAGGADFICLGMFDFQVQEDVALTCKAIAESTNRKRRWF